MYIYIYIIESRTSRNNNSIFFVTSAHVLKRKKRDLFIKRHPFPLKNDRARLQDFADLLQKPMTVLFPSYLLSNTSDPWPPRYPVSEWISLPGHRSGLYLSAGGAAGAAGSAAAGACSSGFA
jgi:hypothetical protein